VNDRDLVIDDVTLRANPAERFESTPDLFCLIKRPDLVDAYLELLGRMQPRRIVELGICKGGSTALMALIARPDKLVSIEMSPRRVGALNTMLERKGLSASAVQHYGTSQGDVATLRSLVNHEFGDQPLDLVIDDASHDLALTRTSFNMLFPLLRPGGRYVIEDWAWALLPFSGAAPGERPLADLLVEAALAIGSKVAGIGDMQVTRDWVMIERDDAKIDDVDGYSLRGALTRPARRLLPPAHRDAAR
jgi:hypothetical protein